MKLNLTMIILFLAASAYSQNVSNKDIIGEWIAKDIVLFDTTWTASELKKLEELKQGLLYSTYYFKSDGTFNQKFQEGAPAIMNELGFLDDAFWKFNEDEGLISIGTPDDNYSLMGIYVRNEYGRMFFIIEESPYLMEVIKK